MFGPAHSANFQRRFFFCGQSPVGFAQTNLTNLHGEHLSRLLSLLQVPKRMRKVSRGLDWKIASATLADLWGKKTPKIPSKNIVEQRFYCNPHFYFDTWWICVFPFRSAFFCGVCHKSLRSTKKPSMTPWRENRKRWTGGRTVSTSTPEMQEVDVKLEHHHMSQNPYEVFNFFIWELQKWTKVGSKKRGNDTWLCNTCRVYIYKYIYIYVVYIHIIIIFI